MNLQTKKIIAKEFLVLTLVLGLGLICFLSIYPYNAYRNSQVENLSKNINVKTKLVDSLRYSYNSKAEKQNWYFEKVSSEFDHDSKYNTKEKVWNRLDDLAKKDSIKFKWEKVWSKELIAFNKEVGFETPESFKVFIEANRIQKLDTDKYNQSLKPNQEVTQLTADKSEIENKTLLSGQQFEFGIKSLIFLSIIFFGLRYLFYAIKWSLKVLKQKSE